MLFFIFCYFLAFYPPTTTKNENIKKGKQWVEIWSSYTSVPKIMIICYTVPEIWHVTDVIVTFHFVQFLPFYPPNSPQNENIKKLKKKNGDIIISRKCTKNHNYTLYCFWDMARYACNFYLSFWAYFLSFYRTKNKTFKKWKKDWRYHHLTRVYQKLWLDEN